MNDTFYDLNQFYVIQFKQTHRIDLIRTEFISCVYTHTHTRRRESSTERNKKKIPFPNPVSYNESAEWKHFSMVHQQTSLSFGRDLRDF